ncbi:xylulokinase [Streptomonospora wellingtoniae]|uniref:Xylulose kinase n=1 Tax=Streptomonospora wellingtoniae TaxID=3075544 RepID=A0ABU2KVQ0_9ACTN|nr:xylulokinase [Streptomonospora sp. DSM 45055]MDT0303370.1 xylulokinase [Streptomonospora sp. DSM 45055]
MLVAGVDSSTQGTKIVVRDADTGALVRRAQAPHPDGTEVEPRHWWDALLKVCGDGLLDGVSAIGVGAQQHGMVALDGEGEVVRPALLWNDTRSAGAAQDLVAELGGPAEWARAVGSVPVASLTVTKLRWLAEHEPDNAARTRRVMLPHDWLTWRLRGETDPVTDRGDASGTGYFDTAEGAYRPDLLRMAFGRDLEVPRVARPAENAGEVRVPGLPEIGTVAPGTGDNMAAALGLEARPGDVVVSLGTSGTAFAVADKPVADSSGLVTGFADATGRFLPLVATLNAARVLDAGARMLDTDLGEFGRLALSAPSGAEGLTLLPYLDGERTPNLPDATGRLDGMTRANLHPAAIARAFVEGMLCGLADAVDALTAQDVPVHRVLLIGGAARSEAVRAIAPQILGRPVVVPEPGEYVADGAARQAAWVLAGTAEPPEWAGPGSAEVYEADAAPRVRERYSRARSALA